MEEAGREGLSVHWRALSVTMKGKPCLRSCSGDADEGSLTAVMGASGAGKTTLLNALSRRGPVTTGEIRYGATPGEPWSRRLKTQVGHVAQDDTVFEELTVREMLAFTAALRLDATPEERERRTDAVLADLQLEKCADTIVGSSDAVEKRGISGGERKRLCVASELLSSPRLLFCDEPTSGLDSAIALVLTQRLRRIASEQGITVVASIHQPSSQIFLAFDRLVLLHLGRTVYRGAPADAAPCFAQLSGGGGCPDGWSHADWVLDWVLDVVSQGGLSEAQLDEAAERCRPPPGDAFTDGASASAASSTASAGSTYANSRWDELRILLRREWRLVRPTLWSNESAVMHVSNAAIVTFMYLRTGYREVDIFPRYTAAWMLCMFWTFFPFIASAEALSDGVLVRLRKEIEVGAYRLSSRFAVISLLSFCSQLVWPALFTPLFFWGARLGGDDVGVFVACGAVVALNVAAFHGLGTLVVACFPERALTALLTTMTFVFSFSGMFKPLAETPFPWLGYANPVCYTTGLVMRLVFRPADTYAPRWEDEGTSSGHGGDVLTRDDVFDRYPVALPAVSSGGSVAVLLLLCVVARVGASAVLTRRMRRLLLTQQDIVEGGGSGGGGGEACNGSDADGVGGGKHAAAAASNGEVSLTTPPTRPRSMRALGSSSSRNGSSSSSRSRAARIAPKSLLSADSAAARAAELVLEEPSGISPSRV